MRWGTITRVVAMQRIAVLILIAVVALALMGILVDPAPDLPFP